MESCHDNFSMKTTIPMILTAFRRTMFASSERVALIVSVSAVSRDVSSPVIQYGKFAYSILWATVHADSTFCLTKTSKYNFVSLASPCSGISPGGWKWFPCV